MSRQRAGLKKEHSLAKEIYELTGGGVIPLRAGWSGNSAVPAPDLLVPYKGSLRSIELKTSGQDRLIVTEEDVEDVVRWSMDMTEIHTFPYLSIKFPYYEVQTFRLEQPWDIEQSFKSLVDRVQFDSNYTRGGNISFGNPTEYDADIVSASQSPGDAAAVLRDLREDTFANVERVEMDTVGVYEVVNDFID